VAQSLLRTLVSGTRQMLAAQLFISVLAIALAGWTLAITSEVIKERDRLRDRVVQLEGELGARGVVAPPSAVVAASASAAALYPPEIGLEASVSPERFSPQQILGDLFAPAPPLRTIVLHVRSETDAAVLAPLAEEMRAGSALNVVVHRTAPRDPRQPAYVYYDGRQSRAAAALVALFNDAARRAEIPQWSAQLRGQALPAEGEFRTDRVDIILPALPAPPAPPLAAAPIASPTP
jgi:hypothetical protein